MSVPAAYLGVIMIWATTPLAIKWSGEGSGFLFGVVGRMTLGAILCLLVVHLMRVKLPWHRQARRTYLAASVGIYGAMLSTYWASQFIPSGWISLLFGLTPIVTSVMASLWLGERSLAPAKFVGMLFGIVGLAIIFGSGLELGTQAVYGICAMLFATVLHSASAIGVKREGASLPALAVTAGGLLYALPLYVVTWVLAGAAWPETVPVRTAGAILYLASFGSVIGFVLYFYVLKHIAAAQVALITLVTPVAALLMGSWLNDEIISARVWTGAALILLGLAFHQWGNSLLLALKRPEARCQNQEDSDTWS